MAGGRLGVKLQNTAVGVVIGVVNVGCVVLPVLVVIGVRRYLYAKE